MKKEQNLVNDDQIKVDADPYPSLDYHFQDQQTQFIVICGKQKTDSQNSDHDSDVKEEFKQNILERRQMNLIEQSQIEKIIQEYKKRSTEELQAYIPGVQNLQKLKLKNQGIVQSSYVPNSIEHHQESLSCHNLANDNLMQSEVFFVERRNSTENEQWKILFEQKSNLLEKALQELQKFRNQNDSLKNVILLQQKNLRDCNQIIDKNKEHLAKQKEVSQSKNIIFKMLKSEISNKSKVIGSKDHQLAQKDIQLSSLKSELTEKITNLQAELKDKIQYYESEIQFVKNPFEKKIKELKNSLQNKEKQWNCAKIICEQKEHENMAKIAKLQYQLDQLTKQHQKYQELIKRNKDLTETCKQLQQKFTQMQKINGELLFENNNLKVSYKKMENVNVCSMLKQEELNHRIHQLGNSLNQLDAGEMKKLIEQRDNLRKDFNKVSKKNSALIIKVKEYEANIKMLKNRLEECPISENEDILFKLRNQNEILKSRLKRQINKSQMQVIYDENVLLPIEMK